MIGLAGWYRRFIKNFAEIIAPISELLKKNTRFVWDKGKQEAFKKLIVALTTAPVLASPDYKIPFEIQADASKKACGAVLVQKQDGGEKVIAYMSQKFTATQQKYTVTELECLAVILAIERFRSYIEGSQFTVITDHHSLLWLKNLKDPNGRLARWALRLQAYDFTLMHRKGKCHTVPDGLSRATDVVNISDVKHSNDEWYNRLKKLSQENPQEHDNLKIVNNKLYINRQMGEKCDNDDCSWKLCVPRELRNTLIGENHDNVNACHFGTFKTIARMKDHYFWPQMNRTIAKYVRQCQVCKQTKAYNQNTTPPAGTFVEAKVPWCVVATDIVGPFIRSRNGNRFLLVAVDVFSKFVELKAVRDSTTPAIIKFLSKQVVLRHGCPQIIISDNGNQYHSHLYEEFTNARGIKTWYTANYFAQANVTECVNKTIGNALRIFMIEELNHKKWDEHVDEIASAINSAVHTGTQKSPYEINYGQKRIQHADHYEERVDVNATRPRDQTYFERMRNVFSFYIIGFSRSEYSESLLKISGPIGHYVCHL